MCVVSLLSLSASPLARQSDLSIHRVALTSESAGCRVCVMVPGGDLEPVAVNKYLQSDHEAQSVAKHYKHTQTFYFAAIKGHMLPFRGRAPGNNV